MNNNFKTLALALAACAAMTGTALAAPKGNPPPRGKAPTAMKAPAHKGHAPARPAAHNTPHNTHQFAHTRPQALPVHHHRPAPPPPPPPPPPPRHHYHGTVVCTHTDCDLGASFLGGLLGALVGAVL